MNAVRGIGRAVFAAVLLTVGVYSPSSMESRRSGTRSCSRVVSTGDTLPSLMAHSLRPSRCWTSLPTRSGRSLCSSPSPTPLYCLGSAARFAAAGGRDRR